MKKICLLLLVVTNLSLSQTKKESTDYINYYFNGNTWSEKYSGGFNFNSFNNSVQFNFENTVTNPTDNSIVGTISKSCVFTLKNIKKVDFRTFLQKDGYDVTILISFHENVYCDDISKQKNELPVTNSGNKYFISFVVKKYVPESELENFKKAVLFMTKI